MTPNQEMPKQSKTNIQEHDSKSENAKTITKAKQKSKDITANQKMPKQNKISKTPSA